MTYTITENPSFNSLEITFDCKPEQAIRDALKRRGYNAGMYCAMD